MSVIIEKKKGMALGTPVLMFDGSIKKVEDIVVGDLLMGPDSKERTVASLDRGGEKRYLVKQTYGFSYTVGAGHSLCFVVPDDDPDQRITLPDQRVLRQGDFLELTVEEYRKLPSELRKAISGYSAAVSFPENADKIDYYKLGSYAAEIQDVVATRSYTAEKLKEIHRSGYIAPVEAYKTFEKKLAPEDFKTINETYRLPQKYLVSSEENRMCLLVGYIDSIAKTSYCERSHVLSLYFKITTAPYHDLGAMDQMAFVAQSLGFKTQRSEAKDGGEHTLKIFGELTKIAELSYYQDIMLEELEVEDTPEVTLRSHLVVKPVGIGECFGFTLQEDDNRFLLGDCTVTAI